MSRSLARGTRTFSTFTPVNGMGSGISTISRTRAMTPAPKSERARRMKLFADTRALFSFSGSVPLRLIKSTRQDSIFSAVSLRSLIESIFARHASR